MGIRKELMEKGKKIEIEREGMVIGRVKRGKERWRIVGVYVNKDIERMLQEVERSVGYKEYGVYTLVGRDFDARTGKEGERVKMGEMGEEEEETGGRRRESKDKKMNKEGRMLVEFLVERGWGIFKCRRG